MRRSDGSYSQFLLVTLCSRLILRKKLEVSLPLQISALTIILHLKSLATVGKHFHSDVPNKLNQFGFLRQKNHLTQNPHDLSHSRPQRKLANERARRKPKQEVKAKTEPIKCLHMPSLISEQRTLTNFMECERKHRSFARRICVESVPSSTTRHSASTSTSFPLRQPALRCP